MRTSLRPRASGTETQRSDRALFGAECRRVPAARRRPAAPGGAIGSKRSGGELTRNPSPLLCSAALALVNPARYLPRFAPCSEQRGLCREVLPRWSSKETAGERLQGSILMGIRFRREIGSAPRRSLQRLSPVDYAPFNPTSFPSPDLHVSVSLPPPPLPPHPRNETLARRKRKSRRHQRSKEGFIAAPFSSSQRTTKLEKKKKKKRQSSPPSGPPPRSPRPRARPSTPSPPSRAAPTTS